jgi:DNA primase
LPEGEDPDSFARKQNASAFNEYIKENETDFVRFKAGLLMKEAGNDPVKKAQTVTEIVDTIALIPEEIIRLVYVKECSLISGVDEAILVRAIAKKRKEKQLQEKKSLYPEAENTEDNPQKTNTQQIHENFSDTNEDFNFEKKSNLDSYERSILRYIVRYGEFDMANNHEEENLEYIPKKEKKLETPVFVVEFVMEELTRDGLIFSNLLYRQILEEAFEKFKEVGFVSENYFKNHPNPQISQLAVDLSTDKYIESKIHSKYRPTSKEDKNLSTLVPYVVINYKYSLLEKQIDDIFKSMKEATDTDDSEQLTSLMRELAIRIQQKKNIALLLGERIVTKI